MNKYIKQEDAVRVALAAQSLGNTAYSDRFEIASSLRNLPAADVVERRLGEWVREDDLVDGEVWSRWKCSECGYIRTRGWEYTEAGRKPKARLCEMCGAEMGR